MRSAGVLLSVVVWVFALQATASAAPPDGLFSDLDRILPSIGVTRKGTAIEAMLRPEAKLTDPRPRLLFVYAPTPDAKLEELIGPVAEAVSDDKRSTWAGVTANPDGVDGATTNGSGGDPTKGYPPQGGFYDSPTDPESRYLWRWIGMHAPDLVIEVVAGKGETWFAPESDLPHLAELARLLNAKKLATDDSLVAQVVKSAPCDTGVIPAVRVVTDSTNYVKTLQAALGKMTLLPSAARVELQQRAARTPREIADQLLQVYGKKLDGIAYIPALALIGRLRQERIVGGTKMPASPIVLAAVESYVSGTKSAADPKGGSNAAGYVVFGELAEITRDKRYTELLLHAANLAFDDDGKPRESMPGHNEMSDAVFMGCPVLAQAAKLTGDEKYAQACLQNLRFMQKLCVREDGLYRHSPLDEAAWGRGNGFPALGLSWSLSELPVTFKGRAEMIAAHRAHLDALLPHQDASGCWHQVIDRPESYREFTCTAMITYALMRGVRYGWLPKSRYEEAIEAGWQALKLRIAADGTLVDVCTGTGKQKSLRDYYDRPAILGRDDRGGAMALMVVTEREMYEGKKK
jgi:rhamnogalacturonyl hydrolase YesR